MMNEAQIIEGIKKGGQDRQKAITLLYNNETCKKQVIAFVKRNSGNDSDGIDMFHEGIIVLDRNIRNDKFRGEGELLGYLYSTCKFLWMNQLRKSSKIEYTSETYTLDATLHETPESLSINTEKRIVLGKVLDKVGGTCKKILELWKLSYSMEEIATQLALKSADVARKQKYKCYKKLVQLVENEPRIGELLKLYKNEGSQQH